MFQTKFLPTLRSLLVAPGTPVIHRDVSWIQFNERVLAESRHVANPLLERAKFLSITASNLDEFFMIRLPSLSRSIVHAVKIGDDVKVRRLRKIRSSILESIAKFVAKQVESLDLLTEELQAHGVRIIRQPLTEDPAFAIGRRIFEQHILVKLAAPELFSGTAMAQLENLQLAAVFGNQWMIRIPKSIPYGFSARDEASGEVLLFFLDDLLYSHLGAAFRLPKSPGIVRVTRDGDFTLDLEEEDSESVPDIVRSSVKTRERGHPARLQYVGDFQAGVLEQCMRSLKLKPQEVVAAPYTLCLNGLWSATGLIPEDVKQKPGLTYAPIKQVIPSDFRNGADIFSVLRTRDYLLHHPYDSFDTYVEWIRAACDDPDVTSIEQTIYRMDALSPVIEHLKRAAASGISVRVLIELRARFDELNNLALADELRKAGVEVGFGFGKLKLHAKVALVARKENGNAVLYTHLSTGNYNATTARQYTDLAIITANPEIGHDARHFFDRAMAGEVPTSFKTLVPAPTKLHKLMTGLIDEEIAAAKAGKKARVVVKVNALVDENIIEKLYQASQAGVKADLIVRGACSLVPGVKGLSDNIRVVSVVDRFLEHSRIYWFESTRKMYLSSADWMPRNFFSRLELAFPVLDERIYSYIESVLIPTYLSDTVKGRELTPQGTWKKRTVYGKQQKIRSQFQFAELAEREYRDTPLNTERPIP